MAKKAIPDGLRSVQPQIVVTGADRALDFCKAAFGAETPHPPMKGPDGKIMHAHLRIGDSVVFVAEAGGFAKPTSSNTFVYVPDVDAVFKKAVAAGAKAVAPPSDMFWGDRWSMVEDPFGNVWQIATHVEDVSPEEMMKRMASMAKAG